MLTEQDRISLLDRRRLSSNRFQMFIDRDAPNRIIEHEMKVLATLKHTCKVAGITDKDYQEYLKTKETK